MSSRVQEEWSNNPTKYTDVEWPLPESILSVCLNDVRHRLLRTFWLGKILWSGGRGRWECPLWDTVSITENEDAFRNILKQSLTIRFILYIVCTSKLTGINLIHHTILNLWNCQWQKQCHRRQNTGHECLKMFAALYAKMCSAGTFGLVLIVWPVNRF